MKDRTDRLDVANTGSPVSLGQLSEALDKSKGGSNLCHCVGSVVGIVEEGRRADSIHVKTLSNAKAGTPPNL